jgi:transposase
VATLGAEETSVDELRARIAGLESALAAERGRAATERERAEAAMAERDRFRSAYQRLVEELELLRRRIFVAKAERIDSVQLELEFAVKRAELARLGVAAAIDESEGAAAPEAAEGNDAPSGDEGDRPERPKGKPRPKPTGRRDVRNTDIPEERVELLDPELEGKAERIGFEESCRLGWRKPGLVRIVVARAKVSHRRRRRIAS